MDFFIGIYDLFLKQPVFNALILLVQVVPGKDFGIAVILLTFGIRFASYPLGAQGIRAQKSLQSCSQKSKSFRKNTRTTSKSRARR